MKTPLEMPFSHNCGITAVLKSSCAAMHIPVFRAAALCTCSKMTISRGVL